jgi:hypothetical protein
LDEYRTGHSLEVCLWLIQIVAAAAMGVGVFQLMQEPRSWGVPVTAISLIVFLVTRSFSRPNPRRGESWLPGEIGHRERNDKDIDR